MEASAANKGLAPKEELDVTIGKDVLELLSSSMYVEPLTIYREYIQNAADSIDQAVNRGALVDRAEGRIDISLDHIGRRILIRDNGAGLSNIEFVDKITAIGASSKRGTDTRGFRGVGRLAGLGYCQELIFRSRSSANEPVREIVWDCKLLKRLLSAPDFKGDLRSTVVEIVNLKSYGGENYPARFFEVELVKPLRIGSDILMNENVIEMYLSEVAPVGFGSEFFLGGEIHAKFREHDVEIKEYEIRINEADDPISRPFVNSIDYSESRAGAVSEVEVFVIPDDKGANAAIGWVLRHDYQGAIPMVHGIRGIRARVGNIQIGTERIFVDLFPEERFNSWAIGEIHILDDRIIPNGRRDNFDSSQQFFNIRNHLTPVITRISRDCRNNSIVRARLKSLDSVIAKVGELLDILEQGAVSKQQAKAFDRELQNKLGEMRRIGEDGSLFILEQEMSVKICKVEERVEKISTLSISNHSLKGVSKQRANAYRELIDLIYECSENRYRAKFLVDRILTKVGDIH